MFKRESAEDIVFNIINLAILTAVLLAVLYPLYFIIIASISDPILVNSGKVYLYPKGVSFDGYARVMANNEIWIGYRNTIFYTVLGTLINLAVTIPAAYALSRKDMDGRNIIMAFFTITMFFSGGLIPTYLVVRGLKMINTFWTLVLPGALSVFNLIVSRTYMASNIPWELQEAGRMDGCSNTRLFFRIVLPLSAPIIAVMALFYGVNHWNSYFTALIYISNKKLKPLQLVLREILLQSSYLAGAGTLEDAESLAVQARIAEVVKYCVIIVSTLPVLMVYPFIQKYFTKGVMLGAIKG
jgi:putative aldouronate transport system permease protein